MTAAPPPVRPPALPSTAQVALPVPVDGCFTYTIPERLRDRVRPGVRVRVPFGPRRLTGFVMEIGSAAGSAGRGALRDIDEVLDAAPLAGARLRDLARWAAGYYFASPGEVLACAVPSPAKGDGGAERVLRLTAAGRRDTAMVEAAIGRSRRRRELVERLRAGDEGVPAADLPRDRAALVRPLAAAGVVAWERPAAVLPSPLPAIDLNPAQRAAAAAIEGALEEGGYAPFLLLGVTGSGKTEVFLRAVETALRQGRSALYLVPEIGLTPLLADRFLRRFGDRTAVLHSGLGRGRRWEAWSRVAAGEARVVLGTRSAVFAPLVRPGLIVVDEEQDTSFKQEERPRYQARDLALVRARREDTVVVLGSATPSLESYHRARLGKYRLLQLTGRVEDRPLARAEIVDMREEFREIGRARALSRALVDGLQETLGAGHQSVLLLNRRGYATFLLCRDCGELVRCPSCSVSLVLHRAEGRMRCHYCGHARPVPETCDNCGGQRLRSGAEGTERLEELLAEAVPEARVVRLDRDTVRRRGEAERILSGFGRGDWDILLGTQMVAKGHDYPRVTLVGVLAAEGTLGLPDFRAAERTFQLLTQVAGRSGRGKTPGRVLIQTFQPDHYAVRHACSQDYEGFYEEEVRFRRLLQYPPFTVLANLIVSRTKPDTAARQGEALAGALRDRGGAFVRVLGPAPAPLSRLRGLHRVQVLLKARARGRLADAIRWALDRTESAGFPRRHVIVDMDPASLL